MPLTSKRCLSRCHLFRVVLPMSGFVWFGTPFIEPQTKHWSGSGYLDEPQTEPVELVHVGSLHVQTWFEHEQRLYPSDFATNSKITTTLTDNNSTDHISIILGCCYSETAPQSMP